MKTTSILIILLLLTACSSDAVEKLAFQKTLEYSLIDLCGEADTACIAAVKTQVEPCMEKADWKKYANGPDTEEVLDKFIVVFYACIVDDQGDPYFEAN